MTRDELLDALTVERYDNTWWTTPTAVVDDSDIATARRRRALAEACGETTEEVA